MIVTKRLWEAVGTLDASEDGKNIPLGLGHALFVSRVIAGPQYANVGGGVFLVKNSWGTDSGHSGYRWVTFRYCQAAAKADVPCEFVGFKRYEVAQ